MSWVATAISSVADVALPAIEGLGSSALSGLGSLGSSALSALGTTGGGLAASALGGLLGANKSASAAQNAAQLQAQAAANAQAQQQANFNTINAQQAPQRTAGYNALNTLGSLGSGTYQQYDANGNPIGVGQGSGYLTRQFGDQDLNANLAPNYAFQLQQGQGATNALNNVAGGGGNAAQGLQQFTQNFAGNAYQNAFNNFQNQRTNIYNTLAGIAGIGQTGQSAANTAGTNLANTNAQLGVGAASALGQGQVGAAQAYGGAINQLGSNATLYSLLNQNNSVNPINYSSPTQAQIAQPGGLQTYFGSNNSAPIQ